MDLHRSGRTMLFLAAVSSILCQGGVVQVGVQATATTTGKNAFIPSSRNSRNNNAVSTTSRHFLSQPKKQGSSFVPFSFVSHGATTTTTTTTTREARSSKTTQDEDDDDVQEDDTNATTNKQSNSNSNNKWLGVGRLLKVRQRVERILQVRSAPRDKPLLLVKEKDDDDDDDDDDSSPFSFPKRILQLGMDKRDNVTTKVLEEEQLYVSPLNEDDDDDDSSPFSFPKRILQMVMEKKDNVGTKLLEEEQVYISPLSNVNNVNDSIINNINNIDNNNRWETAANTTNLSGKWKPIITEEFKQQYDDYLINCSQSFLFRKVVAGGIQFTREVIEQKEQGRLLTITATNPAANWNRTLVSSSSSEDDPAAAASTTTTITITDPDGDLVQVEAWWQDNGTVHKSWLRGKPRVLGGEFETTRFLRGDDVLVCESKFHPNNNTNSKSNNNNSISNTILTSGDFRPASVTWTFQRDNGE
jgi:hypothetical protein